MTAAELVPESGVEKAAATFLDHLEKERHLAPPTLAAYRSDLQQFARFLYPRSPDVRLPLAAVQPGIIRDFLLDLERQGLKPSTVARKLAAIRAFFRFLCGRRILPGNPASGIAAPPNPRRRPDALPLEQVEEAIELPPAHEFAGTRDRAILEVLYGGGIRLGELVPLGLSCLDAERGTLRVTGVDGRERAVPVGKPATAALQAYLQQRAALLIDLDITQVDAGALFVNQRGRRLHRRTVQRIVQRHLSRVADEDGLGPQLLRHTFALHLLDAGADLAAVKELLGHAVLSTTQVYTRVSLEHLRGIYEQAHPRA